MRGAILVSPTSDVYQNKEQFGAMLLTIRSMLKVGDEITLLIGDALRTWNIVTASVPLPEARTRAVVGGAEWIKHFLPVAQEQLGQYYQGILRWSDLINDPQLNYAIKRQEFCNVCKKESCIEILKDVFKDYSVTSAAEFLQQGEKITQQLMKLPESWEKDMVITLMDYALRHFKHKSSESIVTVTLTTTTPSPSQINSKPFLEFLLQDFFPNAYEHQAEEATMLYKCLPSILKTQFNTTLYPSGITPLLARARKEFIVDPSLMNWDEIKKIEKTARKTLAINMTLHTYLDSMSELPANKKEELLSSLQPLLTFLLTMPKKEMPKLTIEIITMLSLATSGRNGASSFKPSSGFFSSDNTPPPSPSPQEFGNEKPSLF